MREYNAGESYRQGEAVRRAGGGRKKKTEIYPNLEKRVVELAEANDGRPEMDGVKPEETVAYVKSWTVKSS